MVDGLSLLLSNLELLRRNYSRGKVNKVYARPGERENQASGRTPHHRSHAGDRVAVGWWILEPRGRIGVRLSTGA